MAQTIVLRRSAQPGKIPDTGSLNLGEVALNTYDGKLFLAKSGSIRSIEQAVVTNSTTTGSITVIGTGSFSHLAISNDVEITGSIYVVTDIVGNGDLDVLGSISGSALKINNSTRFGNTGDDRHEFTGSVSISGSFLVNGSSVGGGTAGPNTFDFNLDPAAAGTVNFIEDGVDGLTKVIAQDNSIEFIVNGVTVANVDSNGISANVPAGTISGSSQLTASFDLRYALSASYLTSLSGAISSSTQVLGGSGVWSGSAQLPSGIISGSNQLTTSFELKGSGIYSSSAQLPSGLISGSSQLTSSFDIRYALSGSSANVNTSSLATTGSNTFIGNQIISGNVFITSSLIIGSASLAPENTLIVGVSPNGGTGEGGQILLVAPGGTYTSASMLDNYQNKFRVLRGTNAGSDAYKLQIDLHSGQIQLPNYNSSTVFVGTPVGYLAFDNSGNIITSSGSAAGGSGTPGGSNTQIQYNNGGAFGGVPVLTYDGTTLRATGSFTGSFTGSILSNNEVVSGSSQITLSSTTGYSTFSSSIATTDSASKAEYTSFSASAASVYYTSANATTFSTSVNSRLVTVEAVSASAASALNSFSASNASTDATQTTNISAASASAAGAFASASAYSASAATVYYTSANATTFSTSVNSRLVTVEAVSASAASALNSFSASNASTDATQTTNISAASASAAGAFASASAYSASAAVVDAAQDVLIASLRTNVVSASVFTTFSTSVDSRLDSVESFTSSIDTTIKNKLNTEGVISGSSQLTSSFDARYKVTISGSVPTNVVTGSLWYDNSDGKTYIYYGNSGTSSWVLQSDPTIDVNSSLQTLQEVTDLGSTTNNAINITNSTPSTGVTSGALIVSGGVGISGSVYAGKFYGDGSGLTGVSATYTETDTLETVIGRGNSTSGSIVVTSTTNATSTTTGNIRTAGGLGVAKDIWANNLYITNTISGSSVTGSFSGSFRGDGSGITGIPGTNTFSTIAVSGQSNVVADSNTDTLTLVAGSNITITTDAGTDSITIASTGGSSGNTFATFSVAGQNNVIADSSTDTMTLVAGSGITITTNDTTDAITFTSTAANNTFATFSVAGQNDVIADSATDTLTLVAGSNITITTNDTADSITIASTGGSAGNTFATFSVAGQNDVVADATSDTITLVAGSNITITTDNTTDSITIASTGGTAGNTFATFSVSGQSDVIADAASDTLTFVAGSGIEITTTAGSDTITITNAVAENINSNQKSITIYDPTNAEDVTMFYTSGSIVISRVNAVLRGSATPSVTVTLRYASDRSAAGTAIVSAQAVTSTTTAETVTLTANTTVPANNFIWLETTAQSGTVNELFLQFSY